MNRPIKFRAWDSKTNEWLFGYNLPNLGGFDMFGEVVLMGEWGAAAWQSISSDEPDRIKLMQSTGLHDKAGTLIYEGDVVTSRRCPEAHFSCTCEKVPDPRFTDAVIFKDGSFQAPELEWPLVNYEVIGNIFEHPGLVEQSL